MIISLLFPLQLSTCRRPGSLTGKMCYRRVWAYYCGHGGYYTGWTYCADRDEDGHQKKTYRENIGICRDCEALYERKVVFANRIATFQAEMLGIKKPEAIFRSIGTLDIYNHDAEDSEKVTPGLNVELDIILRHQTAVLENSEDEDDREDAKNVLSVAWKLLALVPKFFPPALEEPETTAPYHHDLHLKNILMNEQGEITAILDWGKPDLDNEGKTELYLIHKIEYEAS
ncbi:hypothetical protein B0T24DRAFT_724799 [Lasiosphaeria ovina]|uniref:Aminoglycoside phosphotransferase domain-containing protein n=1 Tax=Lasiosphaeria ovina TaxID=92902 RepID=A0AAE0MZ37_9PEZI|nr:hypothetical protein B0T24DRAFT_724799 [Lasiosphaeria ovina]